MTTDTEPAVAGPFEHEALFYDTESAFVAGTVEFITDGLHTNEPVLVVVAADRIAALQSALGNDAERVEFADMRTVGRNPARIIPMWQEFGARHPAKALRGVGEPVWPGRRPAELVEAQCHELLLNLAFADATDMRLLCPYDRHALTRDAIGEAHRSHPSLRDEQRTRVSDAFCADIAAAALTAVLPPAPERLDALAFDGTSLRAVRRRVEEHARHFGLDTRRTADFVLAVDEVATNSVRYGGGTGVMRCWEAEDSLVCEVRDLGRITDPLVGRVRPAPDEISGRGLWIANQLCDLVQVRSDASGSAVRLHMLTTVRELRVALQHPAPKLL
jgi:anti-sigma regulatory factor (Ser/Thr protein kinase)